jgi:sucrose-6F-phosphate phosphohydrolase
VLRRSMMAGFELVVADIDGTMLGDVRSLDEFAGWWAQSSRGMRLAYTSVRSYASVVASIESTMLPLPDVIIAALGTEIRHFPSDVPLATWQARWKPSWDAARVQQTLTRFSEFRPRTQEWPSEFKSSYCVDQASPELLCSVREALAAAGVSADLPPSSQGVDVVPRGASPGAAAMFLAQAWCIPRHAVVVAGATSRDASLYEHGCPGILVANAHRELKALIGCSAYLSPFSYAAGVLDGLRYWLGEQAAEGSRHPQTCHRSD